MAHLKMLIWNDVPKATKDCPRDSAEDWRKVAEQEGLDAVVTSDTNVQAVLAFFEGEKPNVVLLDIVCEEDRQRGIMIAEAIRTKDLLVPILAVSREPDSVYLATSRFEKLGFAGVYHASVMQVGVFGAIALRPSLNQWHLIAPDFALARHCLQSVQAAFGIHDPQFAGELGKMIEALPFSGSVESWHAQVRDPLVRLMQRRKLDKMAERFAGMARIFENADPFYMAGSRSRRHLSHNVQVFLVGLSILLGCEPIRGAAIRQIAGHRPGLPEIDALGDAVLIWACVAATHDTAYLSEHFSSFTERLATVSEQFSCAFNPGDGVKPIKKLKWPDTPHGKVAAKLWVRELPAKVKDRKLDDHYSTIIAKAIARHDSKHFPNAPVDSARWADFLAVLSDEVQDWGRERLDNPPGGRPFETVTWGLFCLEGIQIIQEKTTSPRKWRMAFTFIARDHPEVIAKRFGHGGQETVRNTFARIAKTLRENLRSSWPLMIELVVHFVSSPGDAILGLVPKVAVFREA